ncbi:Type III pantothenate kinase [Pigmentiphaga humi]|uniref:Type III pantothenate kinase n=1 Tax=Pigmentiphaga humi TaxID=2478468 RepID=A0A3P4AVD9_9BURK|nr:type III pantothenate kinase [Pigmentiphaga humi]VCU68014.1 Type III pantothenate kinase [Pigmentiphaga humi]
MTTLLIDAGNSRIKIGWRRGGAYAGPGAPREPVQAAFGHDELAGALPQWLRQAGLRPQRAWGTNVAGAAMEIRLGELLRPYGCRMSWIRSTPSLLGVANGYRDPERLGADRWLGLVGTWNGWLRQAGGQAPPVHVLAHFGTATTVDTLDPAGVFTGGLILPGRDMMRRALAAGTADLPHADGRAVPFPDNTDDAIMSGVAAAQAGAVVRQWLAARARYGQEPRLVASGGAWSAIADEVAHLMQAAGSTQHVQVVDNPVLDGLAFLAESSPPSS